MRRPCRLVGLTGGGGDHGKAVYQKRPAANIHQRQTGRDKVRGVLGALIFVYDPLGPTGPSDSTPNSTPRPSPPTYSSRHFSFRQRPCNLPSSPNIEPDPRPTRSKPWKT